MTDLNAKATTLLSTARSDEAAWCPTRVAILNVFSAFPLRAFPAWRVKNIAEAVELMTMDEARIQIELTKLVRGKTLRARMFQGRRFYEVAL